MWKRVRTFQACGCGTVLSRCSALCGAVSRSRACWRGVCRFRSSVVSSISVCASEQHVCCATPDAICIGSMHSAWFMSHLVVRTHPDVSYHHCFEHGCGAFVLTCGCCWVMVAMKYATGETSVYWYCGEVTQTWPLWMRLQEMDPRLLKRPSSTRCNCWNGSAQKMRD